MQHHRNQPSCALGRRLLPLLITLLGAGPAQALVPADTTAVIGRILIQRQDVFDQARAPYSSFPYPLLNSLHFTTRTQIIQRELLFKSGQPLDSHLVEESARNLRKFPFLGQVTITSARRGNSRDTVDVVVATEDQWTTNPDVVVDRQGNLSRWGIGLEEENFMGFGKSFKMRFLRSTDRTLWRTIYQDPRLLGSRWSLQAKGIIADDGEMGE